MGWFNFRTFILNLFCKHKNKKTLFICYQDRYIKEQCIECNKIIYSDL